MTTLPTLKQLLIPHKAWGRGSDKVSYREYGDDMRAIETWSAQVGGGFYASLTGAGETVSPGALNQNGDLNVNGSSGAGFGTTGGQFNAAGPAGVTIFSARASGSPTVHIYAGVGGGYGGGQILCNASGQELAITGGGNYLSLYDSGGTNLIRIQTGGRLSFFGRTTQTIQTVTGSRGGNAALTSLLQALNLMGLIVDSSTP